jgi:hypothetical protein
MAGCEQGSQARAVISRAAAISAPVDLAAAGDALGTRLQYDLYAKFFIDH